MTKDDNEGLPASACYRDGHAGDCTFYAIPDGDPINGICICGYGLRQMRKGDYSQLRSATGIEQRKADALLLAAAPDLLDACIAAARLPAVGDRDEVKKRLRLAIQKATRGG